MPRTAYGAAGRAAVEMKRQEEAESKHRERVARIIRSEASLLGMKTDKDIAEAAGLPGDSFRNAMSGRTKWTLGSLVRVCDALGMGVEQRAAILGGGRK